MIGCHIAISGATLAAKGAEKQRSELRMVVQIDDSPGRRINEAVVGGDQQPGIAAA